MFQRQLVFLLQLVAWLFACSAMPPNPRLEWSGKFPMNWEAGQSVIVRDVVYFSNFDFTDGTAQGTTSIIAAYNMTDRKLLWHIERQPLIPMANDGERLFVLTGKGIEAISTQDGSTLWQTVVGTAKSDHYYDELLSTDGWLFYSASQSDTTKLYALKAQTGELMWMTSLDAPMDWFKPDPYRGRWNEHRAVNYYGGQLYVRMTTDISGNDKFQFKLTALDALNGSKMWDFPFETPTTRGDSPPFAASNPAYGEQAIYLSTFGSTTYSLRRDNGKVLWTRKLNLDHLFYINDEIIALGDREIVEGINPQTGDMKWSVPLIGGSASMIPPPVFLNGYLIWYIGGLNKGEVSVIDLRSGERVHTAQPSFPSDCSTFPTALALYKERVYLTTLDCIHSFDLSR